MATPWDMMIGGQVLEGIIASYTNVMGAEIFYMFIALIGFMLIYMRTRNFGTVVITSLLLGSAMLGLLPPDVQRIAYFFIVLGIAGIIYMIFKS